MRFLLPAALLTLAIVLGACSSNGGSELGPRPGPLQAGLASARIPAPLGIGTSGYGPFDGAGSESPFAELYPATTRLHSHPEIRVVVLSRGEGFELVFVRLDTVGVFQQLRRALVLELEERLGRDLDDALILGATHTHSGPGRLVPEGGLFDLIADSFFPEYYELLIEELAGAVEAAYADLLPAKAGHVIGWAEGANRNRRCEDGSDYVNSSVPAIAVEREGRLDALILSFAVHGTVLGIGDLTLSRDVPGAIEHAVEERFDHPVKALMFTSWAGDMSAGRPEVEERDGAELPSGYDRMEQVGAAVADSLMEVMGDLETTDAPTIEGRTFRTWIDRQVLGYDDDVFPYDHGAVYCSSQTDCDLAPQRQEGLDRSCIPFPEDQPAPQQTELLVGTLGDLHIVTFTGEPVTSLAEYVKDGMREHDGIEDVMFLGYTQDYLGYSLLEEDWWWGGYESSGTLWGPRQGEHIADFAIEAFGAYLEESHLPGQAPPVPIFEIEPYQRYEPMPAVDPGELLSDVESAYGKTDVVTFTVAGRDPWYGAPVAYLETAAGAPVERPGGQPIDSDGYYFWVDLEPDPPYSEEAPERRFSWTFSFPISRRYDGAGVRLEGPFRFRVVVPGPAGDEMEVLTGELEVAP